jgi:membrane protease YdiL (CAAX protease family)
VKVVLIFALAYLVLVAFLARKKLYQLHPRRFFLETWLEVDARANLARAARAAKLREDGTVETPARHDWRPLAAYVALAVILTLQEYFGDRGTFQRLKDLGWVIDYGGGPTAAATRHFRIFGPLRWLDSPRWTELYALGYWVLTRVAGYMVIPIILIKVWRERVRDYGLKLKGFLEHAWIYALFFGIVLVAVVLVSQTRDFATYYPFYHQAHLSWRGFLYWELMYATQFFALEFFFRGFLLYSAEKSMGAGVILAMVVPYCMIHFGKPWLEALAAILAGIVLGTLSLKTRSIWSGFLIHVTVAISMDFAALLQTTGLPGGFRLPAGWNF